MALIPQIRRKIREMLLWDINARSITNYSYKIVISGSNLKKTLINRQYSYLIKLIRHTYVIYKVLCVSIEFGYIS
jgi:hypothetical protein